MDKVFKDLYKGKKVLVTGHTGFKGCWLCTWLRELGAEVIGYSLDPPSIPSNFIASKLENRLIHIHGDVRDFEHLLEVFEQYEPEVVLHLAAQSLVRFSYRDPKCTFDTNVGGTVNVMEAVRLTPSVRAFINVTSDKCYEKREWVWGYREQDTLGGDDPYSASKGCAELVFASYQRSFFSNKFFSKRKVGVASVRAGNAIGGGDWGADRIIPDCVRALSNSQPVSIRNPQATRPWQHVLEPLSGYLWLGTLLLRQPDKYSGAWNFGPRDEDNRTVMELVEGFIKLWGSGSWTDTSTNEIYSLHETILLKLCCDKAHTYLKWRACLTFEEALKLTFQWYKDYYQYNPPPDMYAKCVTQIQKYISSARRQRLAWANVQEQ